MSRRVGLMLVLAGCLGLAALALFLDRGLFHLVRADREIHRLIAANNTLDDENRDLYRRVIRLGNDPAYIGHVARRELGLVAPGEIVFRFSGEPGPGAKTTPTGRQAP